MEKNIRQAIYWNKRLKLKNETDLRSHVELLLMSERDEDHKEAYTICNEESKSQDGWFRETLALMVWYGIGTRTNRIRAKKIMNKCRLYIRAFPIQPLMWFSSKIYLFDKVYVWGSDDTVRSILCACFQNNLKVNGIITDDTERESIKIINFERIGVEDISSLKRCAIIADSRSESGVVDCRLSKDSALFIYQDIKSGNCHNGLFEINENLDNFEEYVIICNDNHGNDTLSAILSYIGTRKSVTFFTTSEFQRYFEQNNEHDSQRAFLLLSDCDQKQIEIYVRKGAKSNNFFLNYALKFTNHACLIKAGNTHRVETFENLAFNYIIGEKIFKALPEKIDYFICSMLGMGDKYRILCKINGISNYHKLGPTCVLVNQNAKDLPSLFGYNGIILSNHCHASLLFFLRINKWFDKNKINVLGPRGGSNAGTHTGSYSPNMYLPVGISPSSEHHSPKHIPYDPISYPKSIKYLEGEDYYNSVLINPYGYHIRNTTPEFFKNVQVLFEKLALKLSEKNIRVYTNSINDSQPPIRGTEIFRKSILETVSVSRNFKAIITIFTGFMEAMIFTDANLYVITPNKRLSRIHMAKEIHKINYEEFIYDISNVDEIVDSMFERVMSDGPITSKKSEGETNDVVITNRVRFEDFIPEYIELCNERPEWRDRIFSQIFSRMEKNEIDTAIEKITSMSQNDKSAMYFMGRVSDSRFVPNADINKAICYMRVAVLAGADWARNEFFDILWKRGSPEDFKEMIEVISPLVEKGEGNALGRLGRAHREGKGVERDLDKAAEWMRKAVEKNIRWSNELLDILWRIDTPESLEEMIAVANTAIDSGNYSASRQLSRAYYQGRGVSKNIPKALELMRLAVSKNVWWSHLELYDMLFDQGTIEDYDEMVHLLDRPLEKYTGHNLGSVYGRLARAHREGKGVERDLDKAAEWMRKAVEKNIRWSNELLDILWRIDTPESLEEMIAVANTAIDSGNYSASRQLSRAYYQGRGVSKNIPKALELMRLAVSKNVWWSHLELYDMLFDQGTIDDYDEMIRLLDLPLERYKGKDLGSVHGRLARAHSEGKGVDKNYNLAQSYYESASSLRDVWNQEYISFLEYMFTNTEDEGVKIDLSIKLSEKGIKKYYHFLINNHSDKFINGDYKKIIKLSSATDSLNTKDFSNFVNDIYEKYKSIDPLISICSEIYDEINPVEDTNNKNIDCINKLLSIIEEIMENNNINYDLKSFFINLQPFDKNYDIIHKGNCLILAKFDDICSKNKIKYSLAFGTLLGAHRHEASIPWDDDVDVFVFRDDLIRLENALKKDEHLMLVKYIDVTSDTGKFFMAYKVRHRKTPLFLDVFVLDHINGYTCDTWTRFKDLERQFIEDTNKLVNEVSRPYLKDDRVNILLDKYSVEIHKYNNFDSRMEGVIWGLDNCTMWKQFIFDRTDFFPYRMAKFGDKKYPVPNNVEKILDSFYGNIFRLPYDIISKYHYSENEIKKITDSDFVL